MAACHLYVGTPSDHEAISRAEDRHLGKAGTNPATVPGAAAVIVQQGKILDYIDELTQRTETPEEYVQQKIAKSLAREYG